MMRPTTLTISPEPTHIRKPQDILMYLRTLRLTIPQRDTMMLCLDQFSRPIDRHYFPYNPVSPLGPHPQDIFKAAFTHKASRIILISSHPLIRRGPFTPTEEQLNYAAQCSLAGQLLNLPIVDHLMLNDTVFESLLLDFHNQLSRYALRYSQQHANPLLTNLCPN
jgi:DNA repair protein RadC